MPAPMRKLTAGEPLAISASTFNSLVDAAQIVHAQGFRTGGGQPASTPLEPSRIRVRNTSGEDRDRGEILGIDAPAIGPADNLNQFSREIILDGVTPSAEVHTGRFVVLLEPLRDGQIGRAIVSGCVPVRVKLEGEHPEDATGDRFADVLDGDCTRLKSSGFGSAHILWMEPEDEGDPEKDTYWAIVRLGNAQPVIRKAEVHGDLVQGATAPVTGQLLEYVELGDFWWPAGETIEIYPGPSFRGMAFGTTLSVAVGDRVDVYYSTESQQWYAIAGGHWMLAGTTAEEMPSAGTTVDITVTLPPPAGAQGPDAVPREVVIEVYSRWRLDSNKDVVVAWNTAAARWEVIDAQYFALGCGLKASYKEVAPEAGGPKAEVYEVDLNEVAGPGLAVLAGEDPGDCDLLTLDVDGSCGLSVDEEGKLVVVPEDLAGMGLEPGSGCALDIAVGCGLGFDEQDQLAVDVSELAGAGLTTSTCALDVDAGCGLTFGVDGSLQVDPSDLVGTGLGVEGEGCKIGVKLGCGLAQDEFGGLSVDTPDLVGRGLEHEGEELDLCKLAVKPGCGIKLNDEDDSVEVDNAALAGKGLVADEETCEIHVDDTPDEGNEQVLTVLAGATLVLAGCDLKLTKTTREVKLLHNADGILIGVELGEPVETDNTVDIEDCDGGGGGGSAHFIVGALGSELTSGGSSTAAGETVWGTFLDTGETLEAGTLVGACLEEATGKYHVVVAQGCAEGSGGGGIGPFDADRVIISDGSGDLAASSITTTELEALDDITGNIEERLADLENGEFGLTASRALVSDSSGTLDVSAVTATELGYVSGVTSGIQGQLNSISGDVLGLTSDMAGKVSLAGASGGQTISGGTGAGEALTLAGTSHGTPGPVIVGSSLHTPAATITVSTTLTAAHHTVYCDNSSDIVVDVADPATCTGRLHWLEKTSNNTNLVEIEDDNGDPLAALIVQGDWAVIASDGTSWQVFTGSLAGHRAVLRRTTTQSIASTTNTQIVSMTVQADVGGIAGTDEIVIKRPGQYLILVSANGPTFSTSDIWQLYAFLNGSSYGVVTAAGAAISMTTGMAGAFMAALDAGDTVDMRCLQFNPGAASRNISNATLTVLEQR